MSESTTEAEVVEKPEENQGQAGGSPPGGGSQDDAAKAGDPALELRKALTAQGEELAKYREIIEIAKSDPEIFNRLRAKIAGQSHAEDDFSAVEAAFDGEFEDSEQSRKLKKVLRKVFETSSRRAVNELEPSVREASRSAGSAAFERALKVNGVGPDVQDSQEFQEHLEGLRRKRYFVAMEQSDKEAAAEMAANYWRAGPGSRKGFAEERKRVQDIKDSRLNGHAPRGSNAPAKYKVKSPQEYLKLLDSGVDKDQIDY